MDTNKVEKITAAAATATAIAAVTVATVAALTLTRCYEVEVINGVEKTSCYWTIGNCTPPDKKGCP